MGIITVNQSDCLFWLGRYIERVYTTLRVYGRAFDQLLDGREDGYKEYCRKMGVPDIYTDREDFLKRYPFDPTIPDSLRSSLDRAYDNAILLRGELGSQCLAFVELTRYDLQQAETADAPMLPLRNLIDHILAFWGIVDDVIEAEQVRSILKTGKRIERIDMYARMQYDAKEVAHEIRRLAGRIPKTGLTYDKAAIENLQALGKEVPLDYGKVLAQVDEIGANLIP
ncbi:alpha-E domain-containing protein [Acidaminococcus timonensis]|uniref:alpha-E domain-containing protein n=1 Tax=Acidaminococcus timonensis TaxID=1871002 RepID=UPI0026EC4295|nr:alpha-E domain-containing protein [Acidaminococcus timonensis]